MSEGISKLPPHLRPPAWREPKSGAATTYHDPTSAAAIGRIERNRKKKRRPLSRPDWKG